MTFGLLAKALPMKGLPGGHHGGKDCGHGPGHGHPDDGGDGQVGAIKLPAIPGDTTGVTFHFDLDGDGAINGAGDENIYVARSDLDVKGTPGLDDYYKVAASEYGTEHPGARPDAAVGKATIYGPEGQESYYHFTGDEFADDDSGAGGGSHHGGHAHGHGGRFCDSRDDDDRSDHGKGHHDKGGHDKGGHDKGGHDKGAHGGSDKFASGKIGAGGIIQGKIEFGKAALEKLAPDHGGIGKDCAGKDGHGHDHGGTDNAYWKDAGDFFKSLCKPDNGGHDDDRDDQVAGNDDGEDHGHAHHDPMFC